MGESISYVKGDILYVPDDITGHKLNKNCFTKIKRIESYTKDFKKIKIGTMSFKKGLSKLKLKTTKKVGKKSIDFRLLILKNENEKNS